MIIDDFTSDTASGFPKSKWIFTADTVMGGSSTGRAVKKEIAGIPMFQITGEVKAVDGAGFLLASLDLADEGSAFDASTFEGIRLGVRGNGQPYAIHLRTSDCVEPWQFYEATITTDGTWRVETVAFSGFAPQSLKTPFDPGKITQIGVAATGRSFRADLAMVRIAFCKEARKEFNPLSPQEKAVILQRGTERAFTGTYEKHKEGGVYTCKHCGAALFDSSDKFDSHCGWPSFDEAIAGAVLRFPDADGQRIEIVCAECSGHLGHVFYGESLTARDTRYCVNSISLDFSKTSAQEPIAPGNEHD